MVLSQGRSCKCRHVRPESEKVLQSKWYLKVASESERLHDRHVRFVSGKFLQCRQVRLSQ